MILYFYMLIVISGPGYPTPVLRPYPPPSPSLSSTSTTSSPIAPSSTHYIHIPRSATFSTLKSNTPLLARRLYKEITNNVTNLNAEVMSELVNLRNVIASYDQLNFNETVEQLKLKHPNHGRVTNRRFKRGLYKWFGIATEEEVEEQHHRQVLLEAQEGANELNVHKLIQILQTRGEEDGKRDTTVRHLWNRTEEIEHQIQALWSIRIIQGINKEMEDLVKTINTGRLDGTLRSRHRVNSIVIAHRTTPSYTSLMILEPLYETTKVKVSSTRGGLCEFEIEGSTAILPCTKENHLSIYEIRTKIGTAPLHEHHSPPHPAMLEEFACERKLISKMINLPTFCTHDSLLIGWENLHIFSMGEENISGKWKKLNQLQTIQLPSERSRASLVSLMGSVAEVESPIQLPLVMSVAALTISLLHVLLRLVVGTMEWRVREEMTRREEIGAR